MKQFLISLLIAGAVIGGSIAAVTYYNKSQQQKAVSGVLTAAQAGDINAMYDACQKLINVVQKSGNYTGIWIGCEGNPGTPVCHDVANGSGCNPATRPFCEGSSATSSGNAIANPAVIVPEFGNIIPAVNPNVQ